MTHSELIARLGGPGPVSQKLGIPYKNVHNWTRDNPKRGIPSAYMPQVFQMAFAAGMLAEELMAIERHSVPPHVDDVREVSHTEPTV